MKSEPIFQLREMPDTPKHSSQLLISHFIKLTFMQPGRQGESNPQDTFQSHSIPKLYNKKLVKKLKNLMVQKGKIIQESVKSASMFR